MFLAKLTDLHYKIHGLTVLYVPREILNTSIEDASDDKEFIKRMEGVMVYWTKQVSYFNFFFEHSVYVICW